MEFITYNPNINVHLEVTAIFEIGYGGGVIPYLSVQPFRMIRYNTSQIKDIVRLMLFAIVIIFVIMFVTEEIQQALHPQIEDRLYGAEKEDEFGNQIVVEERSTVARLGAYFRVKMTDFWEVLHVLNVLLLIMQIVYLGTWMLSATVQDYSIETHLTTYMNLHDCVMFIRDEQFAKGVSAFVAWLKIFKFLRLNLRLHMMGLTLFTGVRFLSGVLACFIVVVMGYIFLSTLLFGHMSYNYVGVVESATTIFGWSVGDLNLEELINIHPNLGNFVFFTYMLIFYFIGLNFFIAIMTAAFSDVKAVLIEHKEEQADLTWMEICFGRWAQRMLDKMNDWRVKKYLEEQKQFSGQDCSRSQD